MKSVALRIALIILMLVPVPFSCKDKNECLDLYVEPYFKIQGMVFKYIDKYYIDKHGKIQFPELFDQDYDNNVYPCDSMALYLMTPDTLLLYHSQHIIQPRFGFTQELFACNSKRAGYAGTRQLVDKIWVSSNYDFDETHGKDYDLSDIVEIFAYLPNEKVERVLLSEYNKHSPYEAPKRFFLLIKRKPTLSRTQQFVIKYYMKTEPDETPEYYIITTPVFHVR